MRAKCIVICAIGFMGGMLTVPTISLSIAQERGGSAVVSARVPSGTIAAQGPLHARQAATRGTSRPAANVGGLPPSSFFGTTPAQFLGIQDNGCVFYVTTSQADANTWTGASDPRSRPCTPTVNSFNPVWSSPPTRAQRAAWDRETEVLASQYPNITLQQAQPLFQAALANVQN